MGYSKRIEKLESVDGGIVEPTGAIEHDTDTGEYTASLSPGAGNTLSKRYPSPGYAIWPTNSEAGARSVLAEKVSGYSKPLYVLFFTRNEKLRDREIAWWNAGSPGGIEASPVDELWAEHLMPDGKWVRECEGR
jgi:hypothetical protein